jgi:uncharacterized membrane protein YkvI
MTASTTIKGDNNMMTSSEIGSRLDAAHRHEWLEQMQHPNRGRIRSALLLIALIIVSVMPVVDSLAYEEAQQQAIHQMNQRIYALNSEPVTGVR